MALMQSQKSQLLLINKLLNLRDNISPFNVIFDSLEQSAKPLLIEYVRRANIAGTKIIYVSFETVKCPFETAHFVDARGNTPLEIQCHLRGVIECQNEYLVLIDSAASITSNTWNTSDFFSSFTAENVSVVTVFHSPLSIGSLELDKYHPATMALLNHLATTIVTVHSLYQTATKYNAAQTGKSDPFFGVQEEIEGILIGKDANSPHGTLVEVDHRRKSGRSVGLRFVLETSTHFRKGRKMITLAHEYFKNGNLDSSDTTEWAASVGGTFNLNLTKKQKDAREGVVLPYLDAQIGNNEGGRIIYDLGKEDDFDDEEDEI